MMKYNNKFSMDDIHRLNNQKPNKERRINKHTEIILGNIFYYYINLN